MNDSMKLDPYKIDPIIMSTSDLLESAVAASCEPKNDFDAFTTAQILIKNLLTTSTLPSSSTALLLSVTNTTSSSTTKTTPSESSASPESMITKEVNDTQLNLKKILYEPDEKTDGDVKESTLLNGQNNFIIDSQVDDDDRLVIDISDEERRGKKKQKPPKVKSMEDENIKINSEFPFFTCFNTKNFRHVMKNSRNSFKNFLRSFINFFLFVSLGTTYFCIIILICLY